MNECDRSAMDAGWRLRLATAKDLDGLHALGCKPQVYRYLFDAAPPSRQFIADRIAQSIVDQNRTGLGMWLLLQDGSALCAGCVELRSYPAPRCAELTYLLDPVHWGRGLGMRMAWTAITQAFMSAQIDTVIAGADRPNAASFAVMRRLGMRFHKAVRYPLGDGAEYVLHREDTGPKPPPALIPLR